MCVSLVIHAAALSFAGWRWSGVRVAAVAVPSLKVRLRQQSSTQQIPAFTYGDLFSPVYALGTTLGNGAFLAPSGDVPLAGVSAQEAKENGVHQAVVASSAKQTTPEGGSQPAQEASPRFLAASSVDRTALPVSGPDTSMLNGTEVPNGTVKLRLYIDEAGKVVDIRILDADIDDAQLRYARVIEMFKATRFIPALREREEVASFIDIEVDVSELAQQANK